MAIRTIEVPFRDDYNIGVGADLASGSPMGFVVDGTAEGVQSAGGATVNFTVRRIHTTEELHRSLGIDAEASFGSGLFGAGGFSARFSFLERLRSPDQLVIPTAQLQGWLGAPLH